MMKPLSTLLFVLLLTACQQETSVAPSETTLAARVEMASGTPKSLYDSTSKVRVHLVAGGFDAHQTLSFDLHSCRFGGVPVDAPYILVFEGLAKDTSVVLWTGRKEGRTAASSGTGVTASVVAYPVHDTTLSSLALLPGITLLPVFDKSHLTYSAHVSNSTSMIAVAATPADPTDSVFCNEGPCNAIGLAKDTMELRVHVKNLYGNSLGYKVTVVRQAPARDSTLSSLSTQPGRLNAAFSAAQTNYLDTVPAGTDSLTVTALASVLGDVRSITYNGNSRATVPLNATGNTYVDVAVTNKNGNVLVYTITVVKRPKAKAMDTTLTDLSTTIGAFTATFSPSVTSYTDSVPAGTDSLVVKAQAKDTGANVTIASGGIASANVKLAKSGPTVITITVTNANQNSMLYTVTVWRKTAKSVAKDSTLDSLSTDVGDFDIAFADSLRTYSDSVPHGTTQVVVKAVAKVAADVKSITYNGVLRDTIALAATEPTTIDVVVTNRNDHTNTYRITVVKRAPEVARDSSLKSLSTMPGRLDPAFGSGRLSYVDSVPAGVTSIVVSAVPNVTGDVRRITYNGSTDNTVKLSEAGTTTVKVVVTNSNGRECLYTIFVAHEAAPPLDNTKPSVVRGAGTVDTVLDAKVLTFPVTWSVDDNALNQVTIAGRPVTAATAGVFSSLVSIPKDSNWIRLVAVDTSGNTSYDSIMVYRLSAPQVSPAGGVMTSLQTTTATITSPPGADVSFSTGGDVWTPYRNPLLISQSQVLRVKATLNGVSVTDSVVFLYQPTFQVGGGAYASEQSVEISALGSPEIEYSTNGGLKWNTYDAKLKIGSSTRLKARSRMGGVESPEVSAIYAIGPVLSPNGGDYQDTAAILVKGTGADLLEYSVDDGLTWTGGTSLGLNTTTTVQARAMIDGVYSPTTSAIFRIGHDTTLKSVTVADARDEYQATINGKVITIDNLHGLDSSVVIEFKANNRRATVKVNTGSSNVVTLSDGVADVAIEVVNGLSSQTYRLELRTRGRDTIKDARDGETYPVVRIGNQWWMAKNLNHVTTDSSWCYADSAANCATNGRLYPWHTVMGLDRKYDTTRWAGDLSGRLVTGICPEGWHVPNTAQWLVLVDAAKSDPAALRVGSFYDGTNDFGFDAIPTGKRSAASSMLNPYSNGPGARDTAAYFWSASQYDPLSSDRVVLYDRGMNWTPGGETGMGAKPAGFGLRCLKD